MKVKIRVVIKKKRREEGRKEGRNFIEPDPKLKDRTLSANIHF